MWRFDRRDVIAGALFASVTLIFWWPSLGLYFVGDDFLFLRPTDTPLRDAFRPESGWHFIPLTHLVLHLWSVIFNWHPLPIHAVNVLLHGLIGWMLYRLCREWGMAWLGALSAGLLWTSAAVAYEVVFWITEQCYQLVALFGLLGARRWKRYLDRKRPRDYGISVLYFALGLFTLEPGLMVLAFYLAIDLFVVRPVRSWPPPLGALVRKIPRYIAPLLIVALMMVLKIGVRGHVTLAGTSDLSAQPSIQERVDRREQLWFRPERQWRGTGLNAPAQMFRDYLFGVGVTHLPALVWQSQARSPFTGRFAAVGVLIAIGVPFLFWKGTRMVRFFLIWSHAILVPLSIASIPQARYYYLPLVGGCGLVACLFERILRPAGGVRAISRGGRTRGAFAGALLLVYMASGASYLQPRIREWRTGSEVYASLGRFIQERYPSPERIPPMLAVNVPAAITGSSWEVPLGRFPLGCPTFFHILYPEAEPVPKIVPYATETRNDRNWPLLGRLVGERELAVLAHEQDAWVIEFRAEPAVHWVEGF